MELQRKHIFTSDLIIRALNDVSNGAKPLNASVVEPTSLSIVYWSVVYLDFAVA